MFLSAAGIGEATPLLSGNEWQPIMAPLVFLLYARGRASSSGPEGFTTKRAGIKNPV